MVTGAKQAPAAEARELKRITRLLGGPRVLRHTPSNTLDAHELIREGLPARALTHLLDELVVIQPAVSLEKGIGISLRTFQRRKDDLDRLLSQEQSGRTWKFAEILAKATEVFGSQREAERWLEQPATGLNQRCPIDLLATPAGVELVEEHLARLEYGVYA